ncbi:MAG: cell division protein ZapD [Gammaproteobacteria bacterium]
MSDSIIYEQPLAEKVRSFLRLEFLFELVDHNLKADHACDTRAALLHMLDIVGLVSRVDLKSELGKELSRYSILLNGYRDSATVDQARLEIIRREIKQAVILLNAYNGQPGQSLRDHELIGTVLQRNNQGGGPSSFDVPTLHQWLQRPVDVQKAELQEWNSTLTVLRGAVTLYLRLLRDSVTPEEQTAISGVFNVSFGQKRNVKLVRIVLPAYSLLYPEISGGRHRLSVRFMRNTNFAERARQTADDTSFMLACCAF